MSPLLTCKTEGNGPEQPIEPVPNRTTCMALWASNQCYDGLKQQQELLT